MIAPTLHAGLGHHGWSVGDQDFELLQPIGFDLAQITNKLNYSNPKPGDPQPPLNTFAQAMVAQPLRAVRQYSDMGDGQSNLVADTLTSDYGKNRGAGSGNDSMPHNLLAWHENKSGSFTPSEIAKALRAGASHSYQGVGVRRLTPTECERLQAFPDNWTDGVSDSARYQMLGNAVNVNNAEWIGKRIVDFENSQT